MAELSTAAQAVMDAVEVNCIYPTDVHRITAAALRALADELFPDTSEPISNGSVQSASDHDYWEDCQQHRADILAIAAELEAQ